MVLIMSPMQLCSSSNNINSNNNSHSGNSSNDDDHDKDHSCSCCCSHSNSSKSSFYHFSVLLLISIVVLPCNLLLCHTLEVDPQPKAAALHTSTNQHRQEYVLTWRPTGNPYIPYVKDSTNSPNVSFAADNNNASCYWSGLGSNIRLVIALPSTRNITATRVYQAYHDLKVERSLDEFEWLPCSSVNVQSDYGWKRVPCMGEARFLRYIRLGLGRVALCEVDLEFPPDQEEDSIQNYEKVEEEERENTKELLSSITPEETTEGTATTNNSVQCSSVLPNGTATLSQQTPDENSDQLTENISESTDSQLI